MPSRAKKDKTFISTFYKDPSRKELTLVLPMPFSPCMPRPSSISSSASEKLAFDPGRLQGVSAIPNVDIFANAVSIIVSIEDLSLPKDERAPDNCTVTIG